MTAPLRIAVIGQAGQVAKSLLHVLPKHGFDVIALPRPTYDLTRPAELAAAIAAAQPAVVINPAAYTAVDQAEDEPSLAFAINRDGAAAVASAASKAGAAIIHFSTDYVFDGLKTSPYTEDDTTGPQSVYGASKLAGEVAVAGANPRHVIVRTSWVCSPNGANFLKTMLRLATERPELEVVDHQRSSPTFAADLADAIAAMLPACTAANSGAPLFGIFHATSAGETSWCGFAREIMVQSAARGAASVPVHAISSAEYPTKAVRPAYSKLATMKLQRTYGVEMPAWNDALGRCLDDMLGQPKS